VTIRRAATPQDRFTIVSNSWARDIRLSYKARGLLLTLSSHAVGFEVTLEHLVDTSPDGRDAVRTGLIELVDAGYMLRRDRTRNEQGQLKGPDWELVDPAADNPPRPAAAPPGNTAPEEAAAADSPTSDNPTLGEPTLADPTQRRLGTKKTTTTEDELHARRQTKADLFVAFYTDYPRHVGRQAARRAWDRAVRTVDPFTIIDGARRFAADPNRDPQYTPHPATWLNAGRWEDEPLPPRGIAAPAPKAAREW
jgi:hypothetical protein